MVDLNDQVCSCEFDPKKKTAGDQPCCQSCPHCGRRIRNDNFREHLKKCLAVDKTQERIFD